MKDNIIPFCFSRVLSWTFRFGINAYYGSIASRPKFVPVTLGHPHPVPGTRTRGRLGFCPSPPLMSPPHQPTTAYLGGVFFMRPRVNLFFWTPGSGGFCSFFPSPFLLFTPPTPQSLSPLCFPASIGRLSPNCLFISFSIIPSATHLCH